MKISHAAGMLSLLLGLGLQTGCTNDSCPTGETVDNGMCGKAVNDCLAQCHSDLDTVCTTRCFLMNANCKPCIDMTRSSCCPMEYSAWQSCEQSHGCQAADPGCGMQNCMPQIEAFFACYDPMISDSSMADGGQDTADGGATTCSMMLDQCLGTGDCITSSSM